MKPLSGRTDGKAEACGLEATVDMNPVLLKPKGEMTSEVIVHGRHLARHLREHLNIERIKLILEKQELAPL